MRTRKSAEDRRADIRQATLALAFELGPDRVTTGMIADRLGLTQPAIYKHYPGKEDLWTSITEHLAEQIDRNISAAKGQATNPVDRLRLLVLGHLQLVHATPALPAIMVTRPEKGAQVVQTGLQASMAEFTKAILATIRDAQKAGELRADIDAQDISTLILGVIQSLVLRLLITCDPSVLLNDTDRLLELQLSAFSRQGEIG